MPPAKGDSAPNTALKPPAVLGNALTTSQIRAAAVKRQSQSRTVRGTRSSQFFMDSSFGRGSAPV